MNSSFSSQSREKFSRTYHVPWSEGQSSDDKTHDLNQLEKMFSGKEVVVTEKIDGENTSCYSDGFCHARSIDSKFHESRSYVRAKASMMKGQIPSGWRVLGENAYAKHSIFYRELPDYFLCFGIIDDNEIALSWDDVVDWSELLEIPTVPVIWRGVWDAEKVRSLYPFASRVGGEVAEGYVVRVVQSFPMKDYIQNACKFVRKNHVTTDTHWLFSEIVPNLRK